MRSIQVRFDEDLLNRLDASEEVQQRGRSEVLQRAAAEYLGRHCQACEAAETIDARYRKAYENESGLGPELEGWEDQGSWPGK